MKAAVRYSGFFNVCNKVTNSSLSYAIGCDGLITISVLIKLTVALVKKSNVL